MFIKHLTSTSSRCLSATRRKLALVVCRLIGYIEKKETSLDPMKMLIEGFLLSLSAQINPVNYVFISVMTLLTTRRVDSLHLKYLLALCLSATRHICWSSCNISPSEDRQSRTTHRHVARSSNSSSTRQGRNRIPRKKNFDALLWHRSDLIVSSR